MPATARNPFIDPALVAVVQGFAPDRGEGVPHAVGPDYDRHNETADSRMRRAAADLAAIASPADREAAAVKAMGAFTDYLGHLPPEQATKMLAIPHNLAAIAQVANARGVLVADQLAEVGNGADEKRVAYAKVREAIEASLAADKLAHQDPYERFGVDVEDAHLSEMRLNMLADPRRWAGQHAVAVPESRAQVAWWLGGEGAPGVLPPNYSECMGGEVRSLVAEGTGPGGVNWGMDDSDLKKFPVDWNTVSWKSADHTLFGDWQEAGVGRVIVGDVQVKGHDCHVAILHVDGKPLPLLQYLGKDGLLNTILPPGKGDQAVLAAVISVWKAHADRVGLPDAQFKVGESVKGANVALTAQACSQAGIVFDLHDKAMGPLVERAELVGGSALFPESGRRADLLMAQAAFASALVLVDAQTMPDVRNGRLKTIVSDPETRAEYLMVLDDSLRARGVLPGDVKRMVGQVAELATNPPPSQEVVEAVSHHVAEQEPGAEWGLRAKAYRGPLPIY